MSQPLPSPADPTPPSNPAAGASGPDAPKLILRKDGGKKEARFFNRDLSWLEFNRRVLAQSGDERVPLLERVRFLAIFTSNLDEFFMKRVGLIKRQVHAGVTTPSPDGLTPRQQLTLIRDSVADLLEMETKIYREQLLPALAQADIHILGYKDLAAKDRRWVDDWYRVNVFPALTPLSVDPAHRFPFISNLSDNLGLIATPPGAPPRESDELDLDGYHRFARVKIPPTIRRLIPVAPAASQAGKSGKFVLLHDIVRHHMGDMFAGVQVLEQSYFRVTRSAGIQKDELEFNNVLQSVESDLKMRRFARPVRLEIEPGMAPEFQRWLLDKLNLDPQDVYEQPADEYDSLAEIADLDRPELKERPWRPVMPAQLALDTRTSGTSGAGNNAAAASANFFASIRKQDILLHHPYESFKHSVERFIAAAASDPDVVTIKQTLYRTSPDSPFIENLIRAAESGKQVACLVELRARFDENRNVRFARQLEKAGVHVAYGVVGLKTHCKTSLVVRRERNGLRCYAHLGTGNYHPKTAQLYTDLGLLTCDPAITSEVVTLFNFLTGLSAPPPIGNNYSTLLVAPFNMRSRFNQMIDREIEHAKAGKPARIVAKFNSMEDRDIAERLYAASAAGVKVTLIVRGFCCLRPGVPGLSENIRVISVVGRFLEHSRVFHFAAGSEDPLEGEWFISSADWMYRNLSNRVEAAVPVTDTNARRRLQRIIEIMMQDKRNAWELRRDGRYDVRKASATAEPDSPEAAGTFNALMWETGK